jgi:hypothetical protein
MHKDRRWWLNIKVKERPFVEGSSDCKFINLQKLWYLLALSFHCPHHKHLEWLDLMQVQLWSICLTNHKLKTSCPVKYEYPNLMLLDLESQAGCCHCKYMCIIENHQRDTSCPMTWNKPTSKWQDKQIMNNSTFLLFTMGIAFYFEMHRRMFTMGML